MTDGLARALPIFQQALDLDGEERAAFLDEACGPDAALRAEVDTLLGHDAEEDARFDESRLAERRAELDAVAQAGAPPVPAPEPRDPERIGEYEVVRRIGRGGMGIVYEARQEHPRRSVALKVLRPTAATEKTLARFRHEAQILGLLQHPGIAQVYDAGVYDLGDGPQPFFAMELVDGVDLKAWAAAQPDVDARLRLFERLCAAVHHAHQRGVVHRDLKPENVLVTADGVPKVLDFGVARLTDADIELTTMHTDAGQLVGTVAYMSPEQASGEAGDVSAASDVYTLGVLLFELLSGRLPHDVVGRPIPAAVRTIQDEEPTSLRDLDTAFRGDLDTIVARALEKEPARRYPSAAELGADVRRYLAHEPIQARPPSAAYQLAKFARRHRGFTAGVLVAALSLLVGLGLALWFGLDQARLRGEAQRALYRANLSAIPGEVAEGNHGEAVALLEACAPELRGWEWDHMRARVPPLVWSKPLPRYDQQAKINLSSDGAYLAATDGLDSIAVYHVDSGERLFELPVEEGVPATWISLSAAHVAALSQKARLRVFALADGALVFDRVLGEKGYSVEWSADGSRLAAAVALSDTASWESTTEGRAIYAGTLDDFRRVSTGLAGTRVHWIEDDARLVASASFRLNVLDTEDWAVSGGTRYKATTAWDIDIGGRWFLRGVQNGVAGLYGAPWNGAEPALIRELEYSGEPGVRSTTLSRNGAVAGMTTYDGDVVVWDTATGRQVYSERSAGISKVVLDPTGTRIAVRDRFELKVVSLGAVPVRRYAGHTRGVTDILFTPDGHRMITRDERGEVRVWDDLAGDLLVTAPPPPDAADAPVEPLSGSGRPERSDGGEGTGDIALGPEGRELWLVRDDGAFALDLDVGRAFQLRERPAWWTDPVPLAPLEERAAGLPTLGRTIYGVAPDPSGARVAVSLGDGSVRLYDPARGEYVLRLQEHDQYVQLLAWSDDGRRLASAARDGLVLVWESEAPEALAQRHARFVAAREAMEPRVAAALEAAGDVEDLADELRADASLDADRRAVGLRLLRELGSTGG